MHSVIMPLSTNAHMHFAEQPDLLQLAEHYGFTYCQREEKMVKHCNEYFNA